MAAEERYLEEQRENWSYYQYHHLKWMAVLADIDEELAHSLVSLQ